MKTLSMRSVRGIAALLGAIVLGAAAGAPLPAMAMTSEAAATRAQQLLQPGEPAARQAQASPHDTFVLRRAEPLKPDPAGEFHVRFDRTYQGLPVTGGDIIVHLAADGRLTGVTTTLTQPVALPSTKPTIDREQALRLATERFRREGQVGSSSAELLVDTQREPPSASLAWLAQVSGMRCGQTSLMHYLIDARTGALLRRYEGRPSPIPLRCGT